MEKTIRYGIEKRGRLFGTLRKGTRSKRNLRENTVREHKSKKKEGSGRGSLLCRGLQGGQAIPYALKGGKMRGKLARTLGNIGARDAILGVNKEADNDYRSLFLRGLSILRGLEGRDGRAQL